MKADRAGSAGAQGTGQAVAVGSERCGALSGRYRAVALLLIGRIDTDEQRENGQSALDGGVLRRIVCPWPDLLKEGGSRSARAPGCVCIPGREAELHSPSPRFS